MFDGILFDLDGTLWNSSAEVTASWNIVLQREGVDRPPFTDADIAGVMGLTLPDIAARLLPALPRERQLAVIDACCEEESIYLAAHFGGAGRAGRPLSSFCGEQLSGRVYRGLL